MGMAVAMGEFLEKGGLTIVVYSLALSLGWHFIVAENGEILLPLQPSDAD